VWAAVVADNGRWPGRGQAVRGEVKQRKEKSGGGSGRFESRMSEWG
jgi:hypothetical protein